jgi:anti-sigma regulatory factor (Ser/Thr protein kinase)
VLSVELPLEPVGLEAGQARVAAFLEQGGASERIRYKVRLVLDEMIANLQLHGRFLGAPPPVRVDLHWDGLSVLLRMEDTAAPFDPRATPEPSGPPSLDDDRVGGLGLSLVRKMAEIRDYTRTAEDRNLTEFVISDAEVR